MLAATKQLPLSFLLFKRFLSVWFVFCPPPIWTHLCFLERCLNHSCYSFFFFFMVSCQQYSEDIILRIRNMFKRNLVNVIAQYVAFDLCNFILCHNRCSCFEILCNFYFCSKSSIFLKKNYTHLTVF